MVMSETGAGSVSENRGKPTVAEIYSPPRITALLPGYGLYPGVAMDITTNDEDGRPWDFNDPRQRQRARDRLRADRPLVLVGSPMCTAFCRLQAINYAKNAPRPSPSDFGRGPHAPELCVLPVRGAGARMQVLCS